MGKKLFEKKIFKGMIPLVLAVVLISVSFQACQKDEISGQEEPAGMVLKSASIAPVVYPDVFVGPETFAPAKGKLLTQTAILTNADYTKFETAFALVIKNGDGNGNNVVSGANISVNGFQLVSLADFRKAPGIFYKELTGLGETTTIDVEVKGKTTGSLTLWIEGTLILDPLETFTDSRDDHVYKMVTIGDQTWMAENLAYLPSVTEVNQNSLTEPYYFVYGYDGTDVSAAKATANYSTYGVLYNWTAAQTAAPAGWHLPSAAEWEQLENYLIANGYNYDGTTDENKLAKALAARTNWYPSSDSYNVGTPGYSLGLNNRSRFAALPGGLKDYYSWLYITSLGDWWTSTLSTIVGNWGEPCAFVQQINSNEINSFRRDNGSTSHNGFSIRCIKDQP